MANSIKVKVLDKKTLELSENASEGDYIMRAKEIILN